MYVDDTYSISHAIRCFSLSVCFKCVKFDSNHTGDGLKSTLKIFSSLYINSQVSSILHNRMWIPNFILVMVKFTAHENRSILIFTKFAACSWNTIILVFIDLFVCIHAHIHRQSARHCLQLISASSYFMPFVSTMMISPVKLLLLLLWIITMAYLNTFHFILQQLKFKKFSLCRKRNRRSIATKSAKKREIQIVCRWNVI